VHLELALNSTKDCLFSYLQLFVKELDSGYDDFNLAKIEKVASFVK
jgi:hypothetical protein